MKKQSAIESGIGPLGYMPADRVTDGGMSLAPKGYTTRFSTSSETPKDVIRFPLIAARVKGNKRTCTPIVIHNQEDLDANAILAATLEEGLIIMPVPEELQPRPLLPQISR